MQKHLETYVRAILSKGNLALAESIKQTSEKFTRDYLDSFSFMSHEVGLLFGNVQAGKTAQMFGILCAAADASFPIFIILTTDSVVLQMQTYERVISDLEGCGFCVCGEADKQKFIDNQLIIPTIVVLKKNSKVLLQWYNTLASSSFVRGNSLFIIDDEADAASPNTLVNRNRISTINARLNKIKSASVGSIYLQVTGTPQALLLQASNSNFRPSFNCYFKPGKEYLGGDFFFGENRSAIHFIDGEGDDLYEALIHHLTVSAQLLLTDSTVCNFIIHPGVKKLSHRKAKNDVKMHLNDMKAGLNTNEFKRVIKTCYKGLKPSKTEKQPFDAILGKVKELLSNDEVKVIVMNGDTATSDYEYTSGSNVIIGGNVLGRGVTFPKLQTLYYTRTAKKPQADTMWQHSRIFGYDRDAGLMKVFLTKSLYKLFSDINASNNSIISQVERSIDKIQLIFPEGLSPTRRNVIDMRMVNIVTGGTNYYPDDPENIDKSGLDLLLSDFDSASYQIVSLKMILEILSHIIPSEDFNLPAFEGAIKAIISKRPTAQGILMVRKNRAVTQGTGSLLSPNDRTLGDSFSSQVVLTMYQIVGNLGWQQENIWVPNIKLPDFLNFYNVQ